MVADFISISRLNTNSTNFYIRFIVVFDVLSLIDVIYLKELEIKDTTDNVKSASYLDLL